MNCAKKIFPEKFSKFVPKTWFFPEDRHRVNWKLLLNNPHDKRFAPTLIAKPSKGFGGSGIKIVQREEDLPISQNVDLVVQRYITDPLLIDNKKFDLRLYMLLKGVDKVEIFLC
jgi:hypothetical protein